MKEYTLREICDEYRRLENEIQQLLTQSFLNDSERFSIDRVNLVKMDSVVPAGKFPMLIDVKLEVKI